MNRLLIALTVSLAAASLAAPASAGHRATAIPANRLQVWLVERVNPAKAIVQDTKVYFTPEDDRGAIMLVGFDQHGTRRDLQEGENSAYIEARGHGVWPAVYQNSVTLTPACPTYEVCSDPDAVAPYNGYSAKLTAPGPITWSYYVFAYDIDVRVVPSHGWRVRAVKGGSFYAIRNQGTGARLNTAVGTSTVEYFDGATAPLAKGPSVAMANMPCPPQPAGSLSPGSATLVPQPSDHTGILRRMSCAYPGATGASDRATTWRVDVTGTGFSAGWTTFANRLVVAVLPPL
jgi:hypothetical protein